MKGFLAYLAFALFAVSSFAGGASFESKGRHGDGAIRNFGEQYRPKGYVEGFRGGDPAERLESAEKAVLEDSDWGYLECLAAEWDAAAAAKISGLLESLELRAAEGDAKSLFSLYKYYEQKDFGRARGYLQKDVGLLKKYREIADKNAWRMAFDFGGLSGEFYWGLFPADEEVAAKYYELYLEQSKMKSSGE